MSEEKKGFWSRLVSGLSKTRDNIVSGIDAVFNGFSNIDDDFYEEIEEILIMGDIGVNATEAIIENLKKKVKENHIKDPAECKELLINSIKEQMDVGETAYRFENEKSVVLVIGVNGVGKTTSVGKLAGKLKDQGKKVILAAADTFRAAAGTQLHALVNHRAVHCIRLAVKISMNFTRIDFNVPFLASYRHSVDSGITAFCCVHTYRRCRAGSISRHGQTKVTSSM